jgi:5-(carboxyamino)imidazole ribonucleotide synthase
VTLDTEHVPAEILTDIAQITRVLPSPQVLATIQDRAVQKRFLDGLGEPQARWAPVGSPAELAAAVASIGLPAILKARRAGYDGKGQARIEAGCNPTIAWQSIGNVPAVLEALVPFQRELSVVLARGMNGEIREYPIAENVHRRHILHTTRAPAPMPEAQRDIAYELARRIAIALDHVGVMAVEMFKLESGELLVNEIAPRTHNSGHYSYGACATSQFEQHVRAVCGVPLGDPRQFTGAVMVNLVGELWAAGEPHWQHVLDRPNARLHLYGKLTPTPGRKMGHVLVLDDDTERGLRTAEDLIERLTR